MNNLKNSTDIWFCAYLQLQGIKLAKYDVEGRGKVRCYYDVTDDEWKQLRLDFNNSDVSRYKTAVESIKDLAY